MHIPEHIPEAPLEAEFPLTDISEFHRQKGMEWLQKVDNMDHNERVLYINNAFHPKFQNGIDWLHTQAGAETLCRKWDDQRDYKYRDASGAMATAKLANGGMATARAFMNETGIMPNYEANLNEWLTEMATDPDAPKPGEFAENVLNGMQDSHPKLFELHTLLYQHAQNWFGVMEEHEETFRAGLVLPYMLSSAARMARETQDSHFTSLSEDVVKLNSDFGKMFTRENRLSTFALLQVGLRETKARGLRKTIKPIAGRAAVKLNNARRRFRTR